MYICIIYELLVCGLIWDCKPDAATWHAFVVGFLLLRLDLTGDRVGMGSLIYSMKVIARAVSLSLIHI